MYANVGKYSVHSVSPCERCWFTFHGESWRTSSKGWIFGEMLRSHSLQRNPIRFIVTYTIYFIQFLGPRFMVIYEYVYIYEGYSSCNLIIATRVKSGQKINWVMFRNTVKLWKEGALKAAWLGHRAWVFLFLCLPHPLQCLMQTHIFHIFHSGSCQKDFPWLECCVANARYNSGTRMDNKCCIICQAKS